jgi:hypothetical protein
MVLKRAAPGHELRGADNQCVVVLGPEKDDDSQRLLSYDRSAGPMRSFHCFLCTRSCHCFFCSRSFHCFLYTCSFQSFLYSCTTVLPSRLSPLSTSSTFTPAVGSVVVSESLAPQELPVPYPRPRRLEILSRLPGLHRIHRPICCHSRAPRVPCDRHVHVACEYLHSRPCRRRFAPGQKHCELPRDVFDDQSNVQLRLDLLDPRIYICSQVRWVWEDASSIVLKSARGLVLACRYQRGASCGTNKSGDTSCGTIKNGGASCGTNKSGDTSCGTIKTGGAGCATSKKSGGASGGTSKSGGATCGTSKWCYLWH